MSFAKIRPRRGTASQWSNANPILAEGEIGIEVPSTGVGTGNVKIKFGDGSTHWNDLPYGVDTIGNNTDMISEKFMTGIPCVKDNYYIANDTLYKCLKNTDGSIDVSNTNYFKKTTIGAELSSVKSNSTDKWTFKKLTGANNNVTVPSGVKEFYLCPVNNYSQSFNSITIPIELFNYGKTLKFYSYISGDQTVYIMRTSTENVYSINRAGLSFIIFGYR